jgi:hypothetical protein
MLTESDLLGLVIVKKSSLQHIDLDIFIIIII